MKSSEEITAFLDDVFEFAIGEAVYFRGALNCEGHQPIAYVITERALQQCHGGVQRIYKIATRGEFISEIALTRERPPFDPQPTVERKQFEREWYEAVLERRNQKAEE